MGLTDLLKVPSKVADFVEKLTFGTWKTTIDDKLEEEIKEAAKHNNSIATKLNAYDMAVHKLELKKAEHGVNVIKYILISAGICYLGRPIVEVNTEMMEKIMVLLPVSIMTAAYAYLAFKTIGIIGSNYKFRKLITETREAKENLLKAYEESQKPTQKQESDVPYSPSMRPSSRRVKQYFPSSG